MFKNQRSPARPSRHHQRGGERRVDRKAGLAAVVAGFLLAACGSDDSESTLVQSSDEGVVLVMTRVTNPGSRNFYVHLLSDLSESEELDYSQAFEFGEIYVTVHDEHVYVADRDAMTVTKYSVTNDRQLNEQGRVSLQQLGVRFPIVWWASTGQPYVLDFSSGQVVRFDSESMTIVDSTPIPESLLEREGLAAAPWAFNAVESDGRAFFSWSWSDFDTFGHFSAAALAAFPLEGSPVFDSAIEDARCGVSDTVIPWTDDLGRVYVAGLGYFSQLDNQRACVVRTDSAADRFDPDYIVNLSNIVGSPDIYGGWRMEGNRLLINHLPADAPLPDIQSDPTWVFEREDYILSIVDLDQMTVVPVPNIPSGGVMSNFDLSLEGQRYVQVYEGADATLHSVQPDGTSEEVVSAGTNGDFQYMGRVR